MHRPDACTLLSSISLLRPSNSYSQHMLARAPLTATFKSTLLPRLELILLAPSASSSATSSTIRRNMASSTTPSDTQTKHTSITPACLADLRAYWFEHAPKTRGGEPEADQAAVKNAAKRWFMGGEAEDERCRAQFGAAVEAARNTSIQDLLKLATAEKQDALALVLLLDQMPRNIYRGKQARIAYEECDPKARAVVHRCIQPPLSFAARENTDTWWQQSFFYMPLMHSESIDDHNLLKTKLKEALSEAESEAEKNNINMTLEFENKHAAVIERFGRYPSRNEAMGRENTPEETEFLKNGVGW